MAGDGVFSSIAQSIYVEDVSLVYLYVLPTVGSVGTPEIYLFAAAQLVGVLSPTRSDPAVIADGYSLQSALYSSIPERIDSKSDFHRASLADSRAPDNPTVGRTSVSYTHLTLPTIA